MARAARVLTVYMRNELIRRGRRSCATLRLSPLMRALIDHLAAMPSVAESLASRRLRGVLRDQLAHQPELPLFVPALTSSLASRVAETIARAPDDTPRSRDVAAAIGVSARTLERAFVSDVKMTFGEWRQRTRICRAVGLLSDGMSVKDTALEVGYETPSAFVTAFKRYVGTTPGKTKHEGHEAF